MRVRRLAILLTPLLAAQQAPAQQPEANIPLLAQALDRCMVTHAVRLTRTAATDAEIYAQATQSCLALNEQLRAAIGAQLPAAQAGELLRAVDAQAEPNFIALLSRIRADRARRAGE